MAELDVMSRDNEIQEGLQAWLIPETSIGSRHLNLDPSPFQARNHPAKEEVALWQRGTMSHV